ncbi:MAG: 50S ribosomal protein L18Ae [Candidatus Thorarchaeota archaeon]
MSSKIWRATGEYKKERRMFTFAVEMLALKEKHVIEHVYSDLGSKHRVKRREIEFKEVKEIKPKDVTDADLRRTLGLESEV